jgi:sporulation protein YlmC with PRC-barrel domain
MTISKQWDRLIGLTATDAAGDEIGQVGQVYLDERTGQPEWVTVSTGMSGTRQSFAPLDGCSVRDDRLVLPVSKQLVEDAPDIEDDGHLSEAEVTALYQHYAAHLGPAGRGRTEDGGDHRYAGRHAGTGPEMRKS